MKRFLIIGVIGAAAFWLLLLPAAVGLFLNDRAPGWVAERAEDAERHYVPGWFSSRLMASDGSSWWLRLRARHMPPLGLSWTRVRGELLSPMSPQELTVSGRLRISGETDLGIEGRELTLRAEPAVQANTGSLRFNRNRRGTTQLDLDLSGLALHDVLGNQLNFAQSQALLIWRQRGNGLASLYMQLGLEGAAGMRMALQAESVNVIALGELRDGLEQLRSAVPDSVDQRLALLTIAAAWQQLSASGLAVTLHDFAIGSHTRFSGQWSAGQQQPDISGSGRIAALVEGLAPWVGMAQGLDPVAGEQQTSGWVQTLVDGGWLSINGAEFEFRYPPPSGDLTLPVP
ncbi:MAG: hypothetical protein JJU31_03935 [Wenzhouxiangella sp.]|nr:hypothetical protein [Wenzhouxiangella sp.]MCH8478859.1 hypothetical protein [Wenzhouxiangella sp.]TVR94430.1 MAG: hypothetical protein EA418_10225 [Wenzhouxiangellaceae bacterium]